MNVHFEDIDGVVHSPASSTIDFSLGSTETPSAGKISGHKRSPSNDLACTEHRPIKQVHCYNDASIYGYEPLSPIVAKKCAMPVRTISLLSPQGEGDRMTPEEKSAQRAEIADILDQATRVALEIGSCYSSTTNAAAPETNGRRYQRRNSFVDRRRFLAPTLVLDDATATPAANSSSTSGSILDATVDSGLDGSMGATLVSLPWRRSFPTSRLPRSPNDVTTVRSAIEAEFLLRRTSLPFSCVESALEKTVE